MTTQDKTTDKLPQEAAQAPEEQQKKPGRGWLATCALLVCVVAWIVGNREAYSAMAIAVASIVLGGLAMRGASRAVRNAAITAIVASGVLIVVIAAFLIVIYLGLK